MNQKFLDNQPNTIACCKLNKTEMSNCCGNDILGIIWRDKGSWDTHRAEITAKILIIPIDTFCPYSFSLIMCFYIIAKLVIKMPQQLFLSLGQFMSIYVETAEGTFQ